MGRNMTGPLLKINEWQRRTLLLSRPRADDKLGRKFKLFVPFRLYHQGDFMRRAIIAMPEEFTVQSQCQRGKYFCLWLGGSIVFLY